MEGDECRMFLTAERKNVKIELVIIEKKLTATIRLLQVKSIGILIHKMSSDVNERHHGSIRVLRTTSRRHNVSGFDAILQSMLG